jgi:Glycosyl hydrolase 36 superfamily, catalytic domain
VDTSQSAITDTDLHLGDLGTLQSTTHGIGNSTFNFKNAPRKLLRVTYLLEPDNHDSEIWMIDNAAATGITLRYGKRSVSFERSVAFRILDRRIDEVPSVTARERLTATQQKWQKYLGTALDRLGIHDDIQLILLREFIWDIYQVVAMVSTDVFSAPDLPSLTLRNANMGGTYTVLGLDVHGRDTLQMVPAISRFDPVLGREALLNMARYTDKTGRVCHRRFLSGQPIDRDHSDESYWLVSALTDYLQTTHDLSILEEQVPYLENDLRSEYVLFNDPARVRRFDERSIDPARFTTGYNSMLEHARRTLQNVQLGPHGLPLMEDGDWNDALNRMQNGESVLTACPSCATSGSGLGRRK